MLNCCICFNCSFNEIKRWNFSIFCWVPVDSGDQCRVQPLCIRMLDFENPSIVILGGRCQTERIYGFPSFFFFFLGTQRSTGRKEQHSPPRAATIWVPFWSCSMGPFPWKIEYCSFVWNKAKRNLSQNGRWSVVWLTSQVWMDFVSQALPGGSSCSMLFASLPLFSTALRTNFQWLENGSWCCRTFHMGSAHNKEKYR